MDIQLLYMPGGGACSSFVGVRPAPFNSVPILIFYTCYLIKSFYFSLQWLGQCDTFVKCGYIWAAGDYPTLFTFSIAWVTLAILVHAWISCKGEWLQVAQADDALGELKWLLHILATICDYKQVQVGGVSQKINMRARSLLEWFHQKTLCCARR